MVYQKKPVWVNPDWSKAKVYTATGAMQCFGLGCPRGVIQAGAIYTLHRVKASGYYADRATLALIAIQSDRCLPDLIRAQPGEKPCTSTMKNGCVRNNHGKPAEKGGEILLAVYQAWGVCSAAGM